MNAESQSQNLKILYSHMPDNLKKGSIAKKALKYKFDRVQGKLIDERDRQWILRIFYCLKLQDNYLNANDDDLKALVP